ncbi:MAG: hypothetical protein DRQ49_16505 [Gammaproteobacteria bacterium]|nr:MAG: hypothetical protein DRQ49_16505 [Gammaproteobacteria bacterium]
MSNLNHSSELFLAQFSVRPGEIIYLNIYSNITHPLSNQKGGQGVFIAHHHHLVTILVGK